MWKHRVVFMLEKWRELENLIEGRQRYIIPHLFLTSQQRKNTETYYKLSILLPFINIYQMTTSVQTQADNELKISL